MRAVDRYVRHAKAYGGLRVCWETGWDELQPIDLGELAVALRRLASRRRRVGRHGRTTTIERFALTHGETVALIERLIASGCEDADICRYAAASQSLVGKVRRDTGPDPHRFAENEPVNRAIIRNRIENPMGSPSLAVGAPRSPNSRTCAWCSAPLPVTLRADAHYCVGGACRMAAHRARRAAGRGGGVPIKAKTER
jgi:hypothetical protein